MSSKEIIFEQSMFTWLNIWFFLWPGDERIKYLLKIENFIHKTEEKSRSTYNLLPRNVFNKILIYFDLILHDIYLMSMIMVKCEKSVWIQLLNKLYGNYIITIFRNMTKFKIFNIIKYIFSGEMHLIKFKWCIKENLKLRPKLYLIRGNILKDKVNFLK